jgi:hypothetical protein
LITISEFLETVSCGGVRWCRPVLDGITRLSINSRFPVVNCTLAAGTLAQMKQYRATAFLLATAVAGIGCAGDGSASNSSGVEVGAQGIDASDDRGPVSLSLTN